MVEHLRAGEVDFSISPSVDLESRRQVVDYTLPLSSLVTYMGVYRSPGFTTTGFAHLKPFQARLWLAVLIWTMVVTSVAFIISRKPLASTELLTQELGYWILNAVACISRQPDAGQPFLRTNLFAYKFVTFAAAAAAFILHSAYSGVLFSFLSLRQDTGNFYHLAATDYKFSVTDDIKFVLDKRVEVIQQ